LQGACPPTFETARSHGPYRDASRQRGRPGTRETRGGWIAGEALLSLSGFEWTIRSVEMNRMRSPSPVRSRSIAVGWS